MPRNSPGQDSRVITYLILSGSSPRYRRVNVESHTHNANAGPIRNAAMVATRTFTSLAVHRVPSASKGSKDCSRQVIVAGTPTYQIG
jgi:hypothetical protein